MFAERAKVKCVGNPRDKLYGQCAAEFGHERRELVQCRASCVFSHVSSLQSEFHSHIFKSNIQETRDPKV